MNVLDQEIPYYSPDFLARWKRKDGCRPIEAALSYSIPPPACKFRAQVTRVADAPKNLHPKPDAGMEVLELLGGLVESFREDWNRPISDFIPSWKKPLSPQPPATKKASVPPFDLQEIPGAMRKLDMPVSAKLMERWFAGELNYSPLPTDESKLINQDGKPYPPSMYDTTIVKLEWVLKFPRAKMAFDILKTRERLTSTKAMEALREKLTPRRAPHTQINTTNLTLPEIHKLFQYQYATVEGTLEQKFKQYLAREYAFRGIPDDLTGALGSFNFYVAPQMVTFNHDGSSAAVWSVVLYIKDNYTFTDAPGEVSQYLGHWNKDGLVLVPYNKIVEMLNWKLPTLGAMWFPAAVAVGNPKNRSNVYYPVWNTSYRDWQRVHSRGGDFVIFSDYQALELDPPIEVKF
jgi:hypothetical protein